MRVLPAEPGRATADADGVIRLGPGQWAVARAPLRIDTLLGSCVCITLWHPRQRLGAACHYVLPHPPPGATDGDPRYASAVLPRMLTALRTLGADPRQCVAGLFGGAGMFELPGPDIGARNAAWAEDEAARQLLRVVARDLGGNHPRRVRFELDSGRMHVLQTTRAEGAGAATRLLARRPARVDVPTC